MPTLPIQGHYIQWTRGPRTGDPDPNWHTL